jgi:hypothetical protein
MGGGGSKAQSTIKQLNAIAMNVVNKNVQSCIGTAMQSQLIKVRGVTGDVRISGIKQRQGATVNMKCVFTTENQTDIQNEISQHIANFVSAKGGDITGGATNTSQYMNIKNIFNTSIHNETVSKQVASTLQTQTLSAEDIDGSLIIGDIDQQQTANIIAEAIVNSSQYSGVLNNIATQLDAQTDTEGGGIFTSMFGMIGSLIMYGAIAAAIVVAGIALVYGGKYVMGKMGSNPSAATAMAPVSMAQVIPPPPL